jgi:putative addiction module component (TIGR02574 family)
MIPDELGQKLHDRATRGESLSPQEQELLGQWYAVHDQEELAQLSAAPVPDRLAALQSRVQQATAQVVVQAQRSDMAITFTELGIDRLSVRERLDLIEQIWDSLPEAVGHDEVPDWHKDVLAKRLAEAEANPGGGVPWREALAAIRSRRS